MRKKLCEEMFCFSLLHMQCQLPSGFFSRLNIERAVLLYYCTGRLASKKVIWVVPLEQKRKEGSGVSFHSGSHLPRLVYMNALKKKIEFGMTINGLFPDFIPTCLTTTTGCTRPPPSTTLTETQEFSASTHRRHRIC